LRQLLQKLYELDETTNERAQHPDAASVETCFVVDDPAGRCELLAVYPRNDRVVGTSFHNRAYVTDWADNPRADCLVSDAFRSLNDGKHKLPISSAVYDSSAPGVRPIGILVVSVSTPATRALDLELALAKQRQLWAAAVASPAMIYALAVVLWLGRHHMRKVAIGAGTG
jgi:hypothetical protein